MIFMHPDGVPEDWSRTDTWADASSLSDTHVLDDRDARETNLFGAQTSGQVLFYGTHGDLLFSGGITAARGHVGDSPQLTKLTALIESETRDRMTGGVQRVESPVYGCPLHEETDELR